MQNRFKFVLSALTLATLSSSAWAQSDSEPGLFATADITLASDDNIYRVTDDLAVSDNYLSIAPEFKAVGAIGKHRFRASYKGEYAKFNDSSGADYADHDLSGRVDFEHTVRFSTYFSASYLKEHEDPGSINRIQLNISEYNLYNQTSFLAGFAFGRESATGRFTANYRRTDKDYTNNDSDFLDYVGDQFTGRFTYRVAPKTRVYLETVYSELDYETASNFELDNTNIRYRAGLSWDFTNKLTGDINVGYQERDYDLETIQDIDGFAYNAEVSWDINTYTKLEVNAKREAVDSTLEEAGGFLRTSFGADFKHNFTELFKIKAGASLAKDELVFSSNRQDDRLAYMVGFEYDVFRNTTVGIDYTYEERDSTDTTAIYEANIVNLTVSVSLGD